MPNRIVREGILDSERVNMLSWAAEVFYRRLMSVVDDYGRYDGRPELLRARLYPLKTDSLSVSDVKEWLRECIEARLVKVYIVDNKPFIEIIDFNQSIRIKKSKFPAPVENCMQMHADEFKCMQMNSNEINCMSESNPIQSNPKYNITETENQKTSGQIRKIHREHALWLLSDDEDATAQREAIAINCMVMVTQQLLSQFNAHLLNSGLCHNNKTEYLKHLKNWINRNPNIKPNTIKK